MQLHGPRREASLEQDTTLLSRMESLARRIEAEFAEMESGWSAMSPDDRQTLLGLLAAEAPDVAHLLCPTYGRYLGG